MPLIADTLEKMFSELGSSIHKIALYKGLLSLRDEIDQEAKKAQFHNPVIGIAAISSLQLEIEESIEVIERVLEKKHKVIFDELKKHL